MTRRTPKRGKATPRRIRVRGIAREEVDLRKLSRALIQLAQAQAEADAEAEQQRRGKAS